MQKKVQKKNKKGFSLIEVLFALLILSIGIVGIISIMTLNIKTATTSRNQIIAAQLTQEGIELVKNLYDNADSRLVAGLNKTIDVTGSNINFLAPSDYALYVDGNGFYSHNTSGSVTKFSRKIDIVNGSGQKTVTSEVWWDSSSSTPPALTACQTSRKCVFVNMVIPN